MLASTMQFTNNKRDHQPNPPPNTHTTQQPNPPQQKEKNQTPDT
ncbi:hypothetical protein Ssi03_77480 [Sphaerisporangium siamense]|nr:hypothetical protein Ssi03_77480 [Sphaerisporangium siamense]